MVKSRATAPRRARAPRTTARTSDPRRMAEMIDLATEAKQIADNLGEKFLAYLLAMVIQEMSQIESRRAARRAEPPREAPASGKEAT